MHMTQGTSMLPILQTIWERTQPALSWFPHKSGKGKRLCPVEQLELLCKWVFSLPKKTSIRNKTVVLMHLICSSHLFTNSEISQNSLSLTTLFHPLIEHMKLCICREESVSGKSSRVGEESFSQQLSSLNSAFDKQVQEAGGSLKTKHSAVLEKEKPEEKVRHLGDSGVSWGPPRNARGNFPRVRAYLEHFSSGS